MRDPRSPATPRHRRNIGRRCANPAAHPLGVAPGGDQQRRVGRLAQREQVGVEPGDNDGCRGNEDRVAVLAGVLSNPACDLWLRGYIEQTLAGGGDVKARLASVVAETSAERLAGWATHDDEYVRLDVAANPHTDAATLISLRDGHGDGVQPWLAENPSCPPEVLCAFAEGGFFFHRLVRNASCPAEALDAISASSDSGMRAAGRGRGAPQHRPALSGSARRGRQPRCARSARREPRLPVGDGAVVVRARPDL